MSYLSTKRIYESSDQSISLLISNKNRFRRGLRNLLSQINIRDFCWMVWCISALSDGNYEIARKRGYKFNLDKMNRLDRLRHFPKWVFETLFNELLTTPSVLRWHANQRPVSKFPINHVDFAFKLHNAMHSLEDSEDEIWLRDHDVMNMLGKIGYRQFPWQRRFDNLGDLVRSCYIYTFPESDEIFLKSRGFSLEDLIKVGFALWTKSREFPFIGQDMDLTSIGISSTKRDTIVQYLSLDESEIRDFAKKIRPLSISLTSDKPSVLRSRPIIYLNSEREYAVPFPDLLISRISTGLFYDIVSDNGNIRRIVGDNFEEYCEFMLRKFLSEAEISDEYSYNIGKKAINSPDLFINTNGDCSVIVECKSRKVKHALRVADDPNDFKQDLREIAKGVFQIWRYILHVNQYPEQHPAISTDVVGLVVTLDSWLDLSIRGRELVLDMAKEMCRLNNPPISENFQIPVIIININDLEETLARCTLSTFMGSLSKLARHEKYIGYNLTNVHKEEDGIKPPLKAWQFIDGLPIPTALAWLNLQDRD